MNWKNTTRVLMLLGLVLILLYDLAAAYFGGMESTISVQFYELSHRWLVLPFGLGFLCGHLVGQLELNNRNQGRINV